MRSKFSGVLILLTFALFGACGGEDDPTDPTPTPTPSETATPTPTPVSGACTTGTTQGTVAANVDRGGVEWSSVENALSNFLYASVGLNAGETSDYITVTGFGFDIPPD